MEDEAIVAMDVSMRLQSMGLEILGPVDTGEAAVDACEREAVDAVLMDVRLRGSLDGISAAAIIRERWGKPIIFLTAYSDAHTLTRIAEVEPYGYLLKPFDERALWVTLHTALRRREQEEARAAAEAERTRIDARFRAILDHSHDGIISVDGSQRIVIFNGGAATIFGYPVEQALGMPLATLLPAAAAERHQHLVDAVIHGEVVSRPMTLREVLGRRRNGETFPVEVSLSRLSVDGDVMVTAIVRDMTERKRLEAQFNHAQKLETIGRLASAVAHDFNNQLVPIGGYAELLSRALPSDDPRHADALEIQSAAARAARLTRQLLLFGRRDITAPSAIRPDDVLRELSRMLVRLVGSDISVDMQLAAAGVHVHVDPSCFEQIVMNLVVNARDAMVQGGHLLLQTDEMALTATPISIRSASTGRCWRLRVTDTGTGIDEATLQRIFEPFFTTKPAGAGTGIGLSTVASIVERAGGTIDVDSAVGTGTVFTVYLPTHSVGSADPASEVRPVQLAGSAPCAVLLVDDDDDVRRFAGRVLREAGYQVTEARTPRQALAVQPASLHLLVSDMVLPGMSGAELASALVAKHDCPVLLMTGYCDSELHKRGLFSDSWPILRKPFGADDLERAVADQRMRRSASNADSK